MVRVWCRGAPPNELHELGAQPLAGARGWSPRKILSKFGGLAIRNIQIDMKLKVTKSKNIMNKCHNE